MITLPNEIQGEIMSKREVESAINRVVNKAIRYEGGSLMSTNDAAIIRNYITHLETSALAREEKAWDASRLGLVKEPGDWHFEGGFYLDINEWRQAQQQQLDFTDYQNRGKV